MKYDKLKAYWQLTRMNRPIGSLLLLWPTFWALLLASNSLDVNRLPDLHVTLVFVAGVFLMRSAGCVINDYADRKVDGHVKRTKYRPLPAGKITSKEALLLFGVLVVLSFLLVLTMNALTIQLSLIGVVLAFIYPFMKRYTHLPQLFLGFAFSWSIPMAWAAQSGDLPPIVWLLFVVNVLWTVAYDTQYAMVDRDDDLKIGIKSTAILFARFDKLIIGLLQLSCLILLIFLGHIIDLSQSYYWGILVAAGLFVYQQRLIQARDRDDCFTAFLNNNYVGMAITLGIFISVL